MDRGAKSLHDMVIGRVRGAAGIFNFICLGLFISLFVVLFCVCPKLGYVDLAANPRS